MLKKIAMTYDKREVVQNNLLNTILWKHFVNHVHVRFIFSIKVSKAPQQFLFLKEIINYWFVAFLEACLPIIFDLE